MTRLAVLLWCLLGYAFGQVLPDNVEINAAVTDAQGYIYAAGIVFDGKLPVTAGALQSGPGCVGPRDPCANGFVAKLSPSGDTLVWATYFDAIAPGTSNVVLGIGPDGSVYIARSGQLNGTGIATNGYQRTPASILIAQISPDGQKLLGTTFLGGATDSVVGMVVDSRGVFIGGTAQSAGFPTTPGAYQRVPATAGPNSLCVGPGDSFAAKLDLPLRTLVFSTLVGTERGENATSFAVGADGSLYLGATRGTVRGPCWELALTRLSPDASKSIYNVSLDFSVGIFGVFEIAVDADGSAYVGGDNRMFASPTRGAVVRFDGQGKVVASQRIVGLVQTLAIAGGELVISGTAPSANFETTPGTPPPCNVDVGPLFSRAPYIARVARPSLTLTYSAYFQGRQVFPGPDSTVIASFPYTGERSLGLVPAGVPSAGTVTCLANAATFGGYQGRGFAVSPGEVMTLFGEQIGPAEPAVGVPGADGKLATQLAGVQVRVGGVAAPLLYASAKQINLAIPFGVVPGPATRVELWRAGVLVAAFTPTVLKIDPGLTTIGGVRGAQLAALNQDGSLNSKDNPAVAGSVVSIFGTGFGAMTPTPVDGSSPTVAASRVVVDLKAGVNGKDAVIEYAGNAPGLVQGVVQINIRLPAVLDTPISVPGEGRIGISFGGLEVDGFIAVASAAQ